MHPRVFREFERICGPMSITGSVLEVGAVPTDDTLLNLKALNGASEKVGINLEGPFDYRDFHIVKGNANNMECFEDNRFDAVISNACLEHDPFFWRTVSEIRRITRPGGVIVIGVPGYRKMVTDYLTAVMNKTPGLNLLRRNAYLNGLFTSTITFQEHDAPGDYYRFSNQTVREVFFEGMEQVDVRSIMLPPRLIGCCRKPQPATQRAA